jgi:hypothetical protein
MQDRFNTTVVVGCKVAYAGRQGASCWISTGTVTDVDESRCMLRLVGGGAMHNGPALLGRRWIRFEPGRVMVIGT